MDKVIIDSKYVELQLAGGYLELTGKVEIASFLEPKLEAAVDATVLEIEKLIPGNYEDAFLSTLAAQLKVQLKAQLS